MPTRRAFLTGILLTPTLRCASAPTPTTNPTARYKLSWTEKLSWGNLINVTTANGMTIDEKLTDAMAKIVMKGGGVVYFPAGVYRFAKSIVLKNGVILRGADPAGPTLAHDEKYTLPTQFEFPKYVYQPTGDGTPLDTAFRSITVENPATDSNLGLVNIDFNRAHVNFDDDHSEACKAGQNRLVYGCIFRNTAVADASVPNLKINQKPFQRFTSRHTPALEVKASENILIANNRLPKSGDDNFTMNGFVLQGVKKAEMTIDGVVFDYDNRPGMYVNHYSLGGAGGMGPDGTPETHPAGFRKGTHIVDNYIYHTGRLAIGFAGDGVQCVNNISRIPDDIWRPTATGQSLTFGSSTNDNRAVEMRGWRWVVKNNDYIVHRNWAYDRKYKINDGEGLMHEDHANSTVKDSILTGNKGNTYLSIYKTAGIDGLLIEGNQIQLGDGRQTIAGGAAIFASADRNKERFFCRNVRILGNKVNGGGITISGDPAEGNVVKGNVNVGMAKVKIENKALAMVEGNMGFE